MNKNKKNASYIELRDRLLISFGSIVIFLLGSLITIPFFDIDAITGQNFNDLSVLGDTVIKGIYSFSLLGGSAIKRASIFTIGISPYVISSIICRILFNYVPYLVNLKKEDESSEKKYTRTFCLILSIIQSLGFAFIFYNSFKDVYVLTDNYFLFIVINTLSLTAASMFVYWLVQFVSDNGISQGSSLIIATDIISRLPDDLSNFFIDLNQGSISNLSVYISPVMLLFLIVFISFVELSLRKIPIQYPARQKGRSFSMSQRSFLPLKVNLAGVLPAIGAFNFISIIKLGLQNLESMYPFLEKYSDILQVSHPFYFLFSFILTLLLSLFWSKTEYDPKKLAENLQDQKAYIPYIRPGKQTVDFLATKLQSMIVISALYISLITIFPGIISLLVNDELTFGSYGLSILILSSFFQESIRKIDVLIKSAQYPNLIKSIDLGS